MKYEAPYMLSLEELKTWIERLGARLEIDHQSLPAYNQELPAYARVGEGVYIEVDDHRYHYVVHGTRGREGPFYNARFGCTP